MKKMFSCLLVLLALLMPLLAMEADASAPEKGYGVLYSAGNTHIKTFKVNTTSSIRIIFSYDTASGTMWLKKRVLI